jgi:hypothetical protein
MYIFISDGGASVIVGDKGVATPKSVWGGRKGRWSPGRVLGFSCILDTFYDNLKATDLVYFISWMKTLGGYMHHPQFLLSVQRIAKLFRKKRVGQAGFSHIMIFYISVN